MPVSFNTDQLAGIRKEYDEGSLGAELYEIKVGRLTAQMGLMGNRAWSIKEKLGEMFEGPITDKVKGFSGSLLDTYNWLEKVIQTSRFPDNTLNSWKAINTVIDGVKSKLGSWELEKHYKLPEYYLG